MIEGVDYSDARPSPTGLVNVGKHFAGRYVGAGYGAKMLLRPEAQALSDAGLLIVSLVEGAEQDALSGYSKGVQHAQEATAWHHDQGFPWPVPCYFSVDFDVQTNQWPAVADYFRGAASVIGLAWTGIYGGLRAILSAQSDDVARWFFQTYAWSGGVWAPNVHIEQYHNDVFIVGGTVDLDRAPGFEYGGWSMTTPTDATAQIDAINWSVQALQLLLDKIGGGAYKGNAVPFSTTLKAIAADVTAIKDGLSQPVIPPAPAASTVDLTPVLDAIGALSAHLSTVEMPLPIDAVAVAKALAADPGLVAALGQAVAAQLASINLSITLSGTGPGGSRPSLRELHSGRSPCRSTTGPGDGC